jgi:hypothetical protein
MVFNDALHIEAAAIVCHKGVSAQGSTTLIESTNQTVQVEDLLLQNEKPKM